jgi:tRNA(Arg) A34 adenosine deaminase TadA
MDFMEHAARLARKGVEEGAGGPFGAVVAREGRLIAAAHNCVVAANDPTAHAEILAIREACRKLGTFHLDGCEVFTTCEPCPMCLAALHWAHVARVHYALTRDDAAAIGFDDARIHAAMRKPLLPLVQTESAAARAAFDLWRAKPDRVAY